jgi:mitogen-activated protein kinase 1/3
MASEGIELIRTHEGRKTYMVKGVVTFEVDEHYELREAIGAGAYGTVCSAIDLRRSPGSPFFDAALAAAELNGGCVVKRRDGTFVKASPLLSAPSPSPDSQRAPGLPPKIKVPTLRFEPFTAPASSGSSSSAEEHGRPFTGQGTPHVAIKKIHKVFSDLVDAKRILREVKALGYLRGHENVVRLLDVMHPKVPKEQFRDLYVVTELMDTDLHQVLRSKQVLTQEHMRFIMYQLVRCLVWVHSSGIVHRDIKPENLLLTDCCALKVCDFGLARGGYPLSLTAAAASRPHSPHTGSMDQPICQAPLTPTSAAAAAAMPSAVYGHAAPLDLTEYVVTRYYRPPELLIMSRYSHAVVMWSAGCILGEMILGRPLFPGRDYLSQLTLVLQTPGLTNVPRSPEDVDQCFVGGTEGRFFMKEILFGHQLRAAADQQRGSVSLGGGFGGSPVAALRHCMMTRAEGDAARTHLATDQTLEFMRFLLSVDPVSRPCALEALRHPYFAKLYNSNDEVARDNTAPVGVPVLSSSPCAGGVVVDAAAAYESEDDCQRDMWAFDQHELSEEDLRGHFWGEIKRYERRRQRGLTRR